MAFTGAAAFQMITENICRITGLSLAGAASGTIGFAGGAGEVDIPAQFKVFPYTGPDGQLVTPAEAVEVVEIPAAVGVVTRIPITVVKTGADQAGFLATLTNTTAATASPDLEIYVKFKS